MLFDYVKELPEYPNQKKDHQFAGERKRSNDTSYNRKADNKMPSAQGAFETRAADCKTCGRSERIAKNVAAIRNPAFARHSQYKNSDTATAPPSTPHPSIKLLTRKPRDGAMPALGAEGLDN
jgi:hypothetical protein